MNTLTLLMAVVTTSLPFGELADENDTVSKDEIQPLKLVEHQKIWDKAPHNAFTDLIRFQGKWFCAFREGAAHVSPDGALRIITSADGESWKSAALIESDTMDLRDAKLSVTPDGQLMLAGAGAIQTDAGRHHQSLIWLSKDGFAWSKALPVGDPNFWLWRVVWNKDTAYGFGYACGAQPRSLRFYSGQRDSESDKLKFSTVIPKVDVSGTYPNETALMFFEDGTAGCLLRQDGNPKAATWGIARPPYDKWEWKPCNVRVGGPDMIQLPNGKILAAVRLYDRPVRTALCWLDRETGHLTEALELPSGGDTSYAGLVWHQDELWVSYYSSHEGRTSIYLARVELEQ